MSKNKMIMLPREVVEQALDALKASRDRIVEAGGSGWKLSAQACTNAIAALRATLGQQQNEQEPVATVSIKVAGSKTTVDLEWGDLLPTLSDGIHQLYTRPQLRREPLIGEAERQCPHPRANPSTRDAWLDGWEAAERAHNIK